MFVCHPVQRLIGTQRDAITQKNGRLTQTSHQFYTKSPPPPLPFPTLWMRLEQAQHGQRLYCSEGAERYVYLISYRV